MGKKEILGIIRHILTTAGGYFAGQGVLSADDATAIVGGLMAIIGVAASIYDKRKLATG